MQVVAWAVESVYDGETKQIDLFKQEETAARIAFSHGGVVSNLVREADALDEIAKLWALLLDARQELIGTHDFLHGGMSGSTVGFTVARIDAVTEERK